VSYLTLFTSAFLAATIFPAQSEALLLALILGGEHPVWLLVLVATVGNTLGSVLNWWLGRYLHHFRHRRWFPVSEKTLRAAEQRFQKYGLWSLLLSWLPVIGDPLTVVAGLLRVPFWTFLLLVGLAKGARYLLISGVVWFPVGQAVLFGDFRNALLYTHYTP
jgi:membrane protein YqaA with SNARE-associated domain